MSSMIRRIQRTFLGTLIAGTVAAAVPATAHAGNGPADDRMMSVPTPWWVSGITDPYSLGQELQAKGARLTDLRVVNASPLLLEATMVKNEGAYASGWWWFYGLTEQEVADRLSENNARLISIQRYYDGTHWRHAVVMVPNTGANAKAWWWFLGTEAEVVKAVYDHNARPTNLASYLTSAGTRFVVVAVDNTGSNYVPYNWYFGVDAYSLKTLSGADGNIVDVSVNTDDSFNVVYYNSDFAPHGWIQGVPYFDLDENDLVAHMLGDGSRLTLELSYIIHGTGTENGKREYLGIQRDNSN